MSGRGRELTLPAWMTVDKKPSNISQETAHSALSAISLPSSQPSLTITPHCVSIDHQPIVFSQQLNSLISHPPSSVSVPLQMLPLPLPFSGFQNQSLPSGKYSNLSMSSISDPNNDASSWSQHETEDKRKYWYNRLSLMSSFEKPFCLKSPEERSIPPCPWKEYSSGGRKYYSNGTESLWTMPEDYRLWKERIDAVEKKKMLGISSTKTETSLQTSVNTNGRNVIANKSENERLLNETPILIFANAVEAQEVFKDMLASYKVSTTAKLKEVQDLCQNDSRWEVIKAQGDKKQCLAEYQTKQLKVEKEQQKIKARKNRDSFLLMLAENTVIDARTRWRDAVLVLQEDARFKSVEDSREREDLFKDFILELEKKEREDLKKLRTSATEYFNSILEGMLVEGKVTRKCVWNDFRKKILEILLRPELKALDESDFRKCFQDLIGRIDDAFRKSERQKKEEHQQELDLKQKEFRKLLENMVKDGSLTTESRWQDVANSPVIINSPAFVQLREIVEETGGMPGYSAGRDIFDQVLSKVQEIYRADRRLIREMLNSVKVKVSHDSKFNDLKTLVLKMGQMKEIDVEGTLSIAIDNVQTEDGEEVEEILTENVTCSVVSSLVSPAVNQSTGVFSPVENSSLINQLRSLMMDRPVSLNVIFAELLDKAEVDFVEETRQIRKCEDRFVALLRESFYSSDHVGITWEDAKKILQRRSAYDVVSKSDRRRLFTLYMDDLMSKMQSISKSVKLKSIAIDSDFKPCDGNIDLVQRKRTRSFDEQHGRKIGGERDCGHDSNFSK